MRHDSKHLIWMGAGFVALLVIGKVVGISVILLFLLFCLVMLAAMMLGMNHTKDKDNKGGEGHAH